MMSFMLFKSKILQNKETDKDFYENLFLFAARVLQGAFERDNIGKLEEEIARLFRSNAFNISQREHAEQERKEKYKEIDAGIPKKLMNLKADQLDEIDHLVKTMERRVHVPKQSKR